MPRRWLILTLAALLALSVAARVTNACPLCSENLPSDPKAAGLSDNPSGASSPMLAEGFYYSILLMLGMPIVLLGSGTLAVYLAIKKASARQAAVLAARQAAQRAGAAEPTAS